MTEYGISTPAPFTPLPAARTCCSSGRYRFAVRGASARQGGQQALELAALELTLFPVQVVSAGIVEIESSSGSKSSSSSSKYDSSSSEDIVQASKALKLLSTCQRALNTTVPTCEKWAGAFMHSWSSCGSLQDSDECQLQEACTRDPCNPPKVHPVLPKEQQPHTVTGADDWLP